MTTNCGLCRDCKHWENAADFSENVWGFCDMTHTKGQIEDADHAPWHAETKAKAIEEYYSGCLQTRSDFGCVQFEQKPAGVD